MSSRSQTSHSSEPGGRYLVEPKPIHFLATKKVPETRRHMVQRMLLFMILEAAFGDRACIGSDQFLYWDPEDPRLCCAPDAVLRFGTPDERFRSWKTWEQGIPELAIEVISVSDAGDPPWAKKLERYRRIALMELVRFDVDEDDATLRIWDRARGPLSERDSASPGFSKSAILPGYWVVVQDAKGDPWLRLARDPAGQDLYLTKAEQAEAAKQQAEAAKQQAEARVAELEAELARHRKA
ncbi:MAG TPA: Uma2 family endonuclease [Polyangiaceae bacterium]